MFSHFNIEQIIRSLKFKLLATLLAAIGLAGTARADVVTDWNQTAMTSFNAANTRFVLQTRTLAILHAAIFDAVNSVDRSYKPYAIDLQAPTGHGRLEQDLPLLRSASPGLGVAPCAR